MLFITSLEAQPWVYKNPQDGQLLQDWLILGPINAASIIGKSTEETHFNDLRDFYRADFIFENPDISPELGAEKVIDDQSYKWRLIESEQPDIDLADLFTELDYHLVYAYAEIIVNESGEYGFWVGSDDACKIWLNNDLVYQHWGGRGIRIDDDFVFVNLDEGKNKILIGVLNFQMGWGFAFRIVSPESFPTGALVERNVEDVFDTLSDPNEIDYGRLMILIAVFGIIILGSLSLFVYLKIKHRTKTNLQ